MCLLPTDGSGDGRALERALDLAEQAAAYASPNPAVGCVLTRGPQVLGEGAHDYDRRDHAEIAALTAASAAGHSLQGATAFVTLEPCSHHGRTGPCADALLAAGITRCVIATVDPNPLVRGGGLARLRAAGVEVEVLDRGSPLAERARRLNDAFAFSVQHGRPFVTLKTAVSRDSKLAPSPSSRSATAPFWLTGTAAREDVQQLRHRSDAILTGIGTVLADDPSLTDRTGLGRRRSLLRVVLDTRLRLPLESKLVISAGADLMVFCSTDAPAARADALRARGVDVIQLPSTQGKLPLPLVLATLAAVPVRSVLLEAGSTLNTAFLQADLVDKLVLYQAPVTLGPDALPFASHLATEDLYTRLTRHTSASFPNGEAQDIRTTGYLHDPWATLDHA